MGYEERKIKRYIIILNQKFVQVSSHMLHLKSCNLWVGSTSEFKFSLQPLEKYALNMGGMTKIRMYYIRHVVTNLPAKATKGKPATFSQKKA